MRVVDNRKHSESLLFDDAKPGEMYEEMVTRSVYLCIFLDGRRLLLSADSVSILSSDCVGGAFPTECRFRHLDAELVIR